MKLKELRKKLGKTQQEVANDLNLQKQTYQNYELNKRQPDIQTLKQLADYFHVTVDYLLGREVPYFIDKSALTNKQKVLLNLIEELNDPLCEKVEGYMLGLLEMEEDKEKLRNKTRR